MANDSFKVKKSLNIESGGTPSQSGDVTVSSNKLGYHNGTSSSPIVTESHSSTLTNKTLDADQNTLTNVSNSNIKSSAAISLSKLEALSASVVVATNASGVLTSTSVNPADIATIAYVDGRTTGGAASLSGDVTGTIAASVVSTVAGSAAADVHSAELLANAATNLNTPSTIVKRDGSGNFSAATITANLTGNVTGNVTGTLTGNATNVTGVVATSHGGTGQNSSATFPASGTVAIVPSAGPVRSNGSTLSSGNTSLTSEVSGVLPIVNGGTNSSTALVNGCVMTSSLGAIVEAAPITASRAIISDGSGIPTHSSVTSTELGYVSGVTSSIQTQIDTKASNSSLTSHTGASSGVHGVIGIVVGTSDTQTLTNKTLTAPVISSISNTGTLTLPTSTDTLVGRATTDTLTNKAISGSTNTITNVSLTSGVTGTLSIANGGTGQSTASGAFSNLSPMTTTGDMIYSIASSVFRLPIGSAGQVLKAVGGVPTWSSFSGGINYVSSNPDAEFDTTGWSTYADGAAVPVDGTGGSPTATFTRSTSSPLRGTGSFLYTTGALGNGASYAFTIDSADQARNLQISFDWSVSGTIADGDYTVYVYDITNSVLTQVVPYKIGGAVSGTQYSFKGTYQTASNSTSYRLVINQAVSSPGGNIKLDNVYIGPANTSYTSPITDLVTYTPTFGGFGTVTGVSVKSGRIGDKLYIQGVFTAGTVSGSNASVTLGYGANANVTLDTNKLPTGNSIVGGAAQSGTGATSLTVLANPAVPGSILFGIQSASAAGNTNQVGSSLVATGATISFYAQVPITGWSSSAAVSQSDSSEGRVVAARCIKSSALSTVNATWTTITSWTLDSDTHSGFDTTNGTYTCLIPGWYRISASVLFISNSTGVRYVRITKNGTTDTEELIGKGENALSSGDQGIGTTCNVKLVAGDVIRVMAYQTSGGALNVGGTPAGRTSFNIERISGNQSIIASESVNAKYNTSAGGALAASTLTSIDFGTKLYDSHGLVSNAGTGNTATLANGWKFTAFVSGKYAIKVVSYLAAATLTTTQVYEVRLYLNGSQSDTFGTVYGNGAASNVYPVSGSTTISLSAGDYIQIIGIQTTAGSINLNASGKYNYVVIERTGN